MKIKIIKAFPSFPTFPLCEWKRWKLLSQINDYHSLFIIIMYNYIHYLLDNLKPILNIIQIIIHTLKTN